jgi:flagellar FliL protein
MAAKDKKNAQAGNEAPAPAKGGKNRKKLLMLAGGGILLVAGGLGGAFYAGMLDGVPGVGPEHAADGETARTEGAEPIFYELPDIVVSLNTGERKSRFLKVRVNLELATTDDLPQIERVMPRIMDHFQVYLRELRIEDINGSAGTFRLREELLKRVSASARPAQINDVLFVEMIIQ